METLHLDKSFEKIVPARGNNGERSIVIHLSIESFIDEEVSNEYDEIRKYLNKQGYF